MANDRKEPIIDKDVYTLEERVKLTWRDVRELSLEEPTRVAPTLAAQPPASGSAASATAPQTAGSAQSAVTQVAAVTATNPQSAASVSPARVNAPTSTSSAPQTPPVKSPLTIPETPQTVVRHVILTDEQVADLIKRLSIEIEAHVRQSISETIELSLTNAMTRVRADVDRSLTNLVSEAVSRELNKINWRQKG